MIVVAGIDVSKAKLDVHLDGKDRFLPNNRDGWFRAAGVERVVLEATGRMRRVLVQPLHAVRFTVCVADPGQHDFRQESGWNPNMDKF